MSRKLTRLRKQTLSSFDLTAAKRNAALRNIICATSTEEQERWRRVDETFANTKDGKEGRNTLSKTWTLGDVMDAWVTETTRRHPDEDPDCLHVDPTDWWCAFLIEQGITILDWKHMPVNTVRPERLSKKFWLKHPITDLPTLTHAVTVDRIKRLLRHIFGANGAPTVTDLLRLDPQQNARDWLNQSRTAIDATRTLLYKIGFRYEDGPFMQAYTKRRVRMHVIAKLGKSKRSANTFVEDAQALGWTQWRWED